MPLFSHKHPTAERQGTVPETFRKNTLAKLQGLPKDIRETRKGKGLGHSIRKEEEEDNGMAEVSGTTEGWLRGGNLQLT